MPITAQGTVVTFAGTIIGKVVGVTGTFSTGAKEIRQLAYNVAPDTGQYLSILEKTTCDQTIELEVIADAFDLSRVGTKGPLKVNGTGWYINLGSAFLENIKVTAKVADVIRLTYAFKRTYY